MQIGVRISSLRKNLKMTQEELADKLGVSRQTVSKWEQNIVNPDMDNLINLSQVLNVEVGYLMTGKRLKNNKIRVLDYLVLSVGIIFLLLTVILIIVNPKTLDHNSSVIYINGYYILGVISFILIVFGIYIAYKRKDGK